MHIIQCYSLNSSHSWVFLLRFFFFFWMQTIFKVFIVFFTILLLFYVLVFWPGGKWEFSSQTRDPTLTPDCIGRQRVCVCVCVCVCARARARACVCVCVCVLKFMLWKVCKTVKTASICYLYIIILFNYSTIVRTSPNYMVFDLQALGHTYLEHKE